MPRQANFQVIWSCGQNQSGTFASGYGGNVHTNYVWGPDLGSPTHGHTSWQKAGGVGGLIYVGGGPNSGTYAKQFPLMDRLGNVTGYRRAVTNSPAALDAVYEYDPFGREVRSTGPASDLMPFRFSTKYTDPESGLVYYGYRFYDPDRGRWINRDPIEERGGLNLYGMVGNNALFNIDVLGNFQWYGNYGGPNWTNGDSDPGSATSPGDVGPPVGPLPIDGQDACYLEHDIGHKVCDRAGLSSRDLCLCKRAVDRACSACLSGALASGTAGTSVGARLKARLAAIAFSITNSCCP